MPLRFEKVETAEQKAVLAQAAHDIWFEYWPALIGEDQTAYMVEMFQSPEAIERDLAENGYWYWLLYDAEGTLVGYTGVRPEKFAGREDSPEANAHGTKITQLYPNRLFISKIYLYAEQRGKHYASEVLRFLTDFSREQGLDGMYLTVNIDNELGIRAYKGNGFESIEDVKADIGSGFFMDDHIMAVAIP